MVSALAGHLRDEGMAVAVLSRGYGGRGKGVHVVSTGEGPLLGPLVAGDEPVLLAGELDNVAVVVGPDRVAAGRHALERLEPPPDVFVLDDGFSHLRLFRDVDLVIFPADDPFAGARLLPSGRLREPLASMRRADAALLIGATESAARKLAETLRPFGFEGPGFASSIRPEPARLARGEPLATGSKVLSVAAIARPERFLTTVLEQGFQVVDSLTFPDHHSYPVRSLRRIERVWRHSGAEFVLTTTKDRVKLHGRLDLPLAELPIRAVPEEPFWDWLHRRLRQQMAEETEA